MNNIDRDLEDALENAAVELMHQKLGWEALNCMNEYFGAPADVPPDGVYLGRTSDYEVVLIERLRPALHKFNGLPESAIDAAIAEITRDRSRMTLEAANADVYQLLKEGVPVHYRDNLGVERDTNVKVIEWERWDQNDFFLASQFWVSNQHERKRPDLLGFVNGIPLLFIELKSPRRQVKRAYDDNLREYKRTIPHLFWYNGFVILSNGRKSRIGSFTAPFKEFTPWRKIEDEKEKPIEEDRDRHTSIETMLLGTCEKKRFLDMIENFVLYRGSQKIVGRMHQYFGVNNAIDALEYTRQNEGRLGVFWHTTGSGKSFSMIFFTQKILRKISGKWTFLVVTDRDDLDEQIYKEFARTGAVFEDEKAVRAGSRDHLEKLLKENHRYLFTMIQKFHTRRGDVFPETSPRDDIIVITDEAHRSQYDTFAANMRNALPKASYIGFTATPLMRGEEKTRQVFGEYVSIYNFRQSSEDGATVPMYYDDRGVQLKLTNPSLNDEMYQHLEDAAVDPEQEKFFNRRFVREYPLITDDHRLEVIAKDIVSHFMERGFMGKAMVISIDRFTCKRMYDKVQKYWQIYIDDLKAKLQTCQPEEREGYKSKILYMQETEMEVVFSLVQNDEEEFKKKGLDIKPHLKKLRKEKDQIEERFKEKPDDPLRLVFLCAMWTVGFNAPSCSTIYLDKPMKNHTLMQTISRANRVFGEKQHGLIVDYIDVFKDLQKSLEIYATGEGGTKPGELPVKPKDELIQLLEEAIDSAIAFCKDRGVDVRAISNNNTFRRISEMDDAARVLVDAHEIDDTVEKLLINDELKRQYMLLAYQVELYYKAIFPDKRQHQYKPLRDVIRVLREYIATLNPDIELSDDLVAKTEKTLDQSIHTRGQFVIKQSEGVIDLTKLDFEVLLKKYQQTQNKRTVAEQLREQVRRRMKLLVHVNKGRLNYYNEFERLIEEYNNTSDVEILVAKLRELSKHFDAEEQRRIQENLTEEELALFDILLNPKVKLSKQEHELVKQVALDLLKALKWKKLVIGWRKKTETQSKVKVTIGEILDQLPAAYDNIIAPKTFQDVYQHFYENYYGAGESIYSQVG